MSGSSEHSLSDGEVEDIKNLTSSNHDNTSLILIVQEQVLEKEKCVREQQLALDLKDERLRDCQANLTEYDNKISSIEAQIR